MTLIRLKITIFLFCLLLPLSGQAQDFLFSDDIPGSGSLFGNAQNQDDDKDSGPSVINQYDDKYKPGANPAETNNALIPQGTYDMFLSRDANLNGDEFVLNFISNVAVNGCLEITQPTIETRIAKPLYFITITNAQLAVKDDVQRPHYECDQSIQYAKASLILDKNELMEKGIKKLMLQSSAASDEITLDITNDFIALKPKSQTAFQAKATGQKTDPLKHEFYPANTLVLFAPGAPKGLNLNAHITKAANKLRLVEGRFAKKNAQEGLKNQNFMYFIDASGQIVKDLKKDDQIKITTISYDEEFTGPNGSYTKPKTLEIYGRRPNDLD